MSTVKRSKKDVQRCIKRNLKSNEEDDQNKLLKGCNLIYSFCKPALDFHLGHLCWIRKLKDLLENDYAHNKLNLWILDPIELYNKNDFFELQKAKITKYFLKDIFKLNPYNTEDRVQIELRSHLSKSYNENDVERTRKELEKAYDRVQETLNKSNLTITGLENNENQILFKSLLRCQEMLRIEKKGFIKAATFLQLDIQNSPEQNYFLLFSERHRYIGILYKLLLMEAGFEGPIGILYHNTLPNIQNKKCMTRKNCVYITTSRNAIEENLRNIPNTTNNNFVPKILKLLIYPEREASGRGRDEANEIIFPWLSEIVLNHNNNLTEGKKRADWGGEWFKVTNYSLVDLMLRQIDNTSACFDQLVNKHPERYFQEYLKLKDSIVQKFINAKLNPSTDIRIQTIIGRIANLIKATENVDFQLYLTEKRHRDHFVHQFNVASLGWHLLNIYINDNYKLVDKIANIYEVDIGTITITWWIASLLHDHAYPVQSTLWSLQRLEYLKNTTILNDVVRNYTNAFKSSGRSGWLSNDLQDVLFIFDRRRGDNTLVSEIKKVVFEKLQELNEDIRKKLNLELDLTNCNTEKYYCDHGVLGAINLFGITKDLGNNLGEMTKPLEIAGKAIFLHNLNGMNGLPRHEIDFSKDPLVYLLILVDEIQEWSRTIFGDNGPYVVSQEASLGSFEKHKTKAGEFSFNNQELRVNFIFNDHAKRQASGWDFRVFEEMKDHNLKRITASQEQENKTEKQLRYTLSISLEDIMK